MTEFGRATICFFMVRRDCFSYFLVFLFLNCAFSALACNSGKCNTAFLLEEKYSTQDLVYTSAAGIVLGYGIAGMVVWKYFPGEKEWQCPRGLELKYCITDQTRLNDTVLMTYNCVSPREGLVGGQLYCEQNQIFVFAAYNYPSWVYDVGITSIMSTVVGGLMMGFRIFAGVYTCVQRERILRAEQI